MNRAKSGNLFPIALVTILCGGAVPLWAGVEDLLEPLDFSAYKKLPQSTDSIKTLTGAVSTSGAGTSSMTGVITRESIQDRLAKALVKRFGLRGRMEVEVAQWTSPEISGQWTLELQQASPERPSTTALVRFIVRTPSSRIGPISLPIRCRHMKEIHIAGRALNRGERLSSDLLEKRMVDVLRQNMRIISADVDLEGFELIGSVSPGSPIRWNHVNSIPSVRKGQVIDVFAAGKGLYISMKGVAMQDGGNGEYIKVRNLSSKQEFQAKVLNESSVKVYF